MVRSWSPVTVSAFFVGGDDGGEKLAGKFAPVMVEEIFKRAADAAVRIGRAQEDDVGLFDAGFQGGKGGTGMGGVRVVEGEGSCSKSRRVHPSSPPDSSCRAAC